MPITNDDYFKGLYGVSKALGNRNFASDYTFVPVGFEHMALLFKSFNVPVLSTGEAVEVPLPTGIAHWQPSQIKVNFQSPVMLSETVAGHAEQFLRDVISKQNGQFDAKIYSGTPDRYFFVWTLRDCSMNVEPMEADAEGRTQLQMLSGTLFYHYFGEKKAGPLQLVTGSPLSPRL